MIDLIVRGFYLYFVFQQFGVVVNYAAGLISLRVVYALGLCDVFIFCHYCGFIWAACLWCHLYLQSWGYDI